MYLQIIHTHTVWDRKLDITEVAGVFVYHLMQEKQ